MATNTPLTSEERLEIVEALRRGNLSTSGDRPAIQSQSIDGQFYRKGRGHRLLSPA
jgi:hypothetical protein